MAANFFTGAVNSNWNNSGNWSLASIPTASDGNVATFNLASPACTVTASSVCNGIDFTAYTNTITMTNSITISGNCTLATAGTFTVSGSGSLIMQASGTMTSATFVWPNSITMQGTSQTYTWADDWNITGSFTVAGATQMTFTGSHKINVSTNFACNNVLISTTGTTRIVLVGTGTWTQTSTLECDIEINTAGTITPGVNTVASGTSTAIIYTAVGTYVKASMTCLNVTLTVNCSGITFSIFTPEGTTTFAGSNGCDFDQITDSSGVFGLVLHSGNTYNVLKSLGPLTQSTTSSFSSITASTLSSDAFLNIANTLTLANNNLRCMLIRDINSSGGSQPGFVRTKGTLTRATNWYIMTTPLIVSTTAS